MSVFDRISDRLKEQKQYINELHKIIDSLTKGPLGPEAQQDAKDRLHAINCIKEIRRCEADVFYSLQRCLNADR